MSVLNSTVLGKCWLSASNDFQQRIPDPSCNDYAEVVNELFAPYNNDLFNQFAGLLNGLAGSYVNSKLFLNPLRDLKKPALQWGNSVREIGIKYLQAHSYKNDSETLLKVEKPEYREWWYSVSTPRRYEFSWSRFELQRVFASDGSGFDDLLTGTLNTMYSSDNYDEMNIMLQMFAEADNRLGGIYRYNLSAAPTTESTGKELLTAIREVAGMMQFPSMRYNHIDIPTFETAGDNGSLILWATPSTLANLDVQTLSSVFQLDKAEIKYRIIMIPEFPIPNVAAALTSDDFIYCRDVHYGVEPPFYNPENMTYKYYLHHAQIIGVNPLANACLFTTDEATVIPTVTMTPSALTFVPDSGNIAVGGTLQLYPQFTGSVTANGFGIDVEPDSCLYDIVAVDSNSDPITLNSRTYVDSYNVLHLQKTGIEASATLTITGTATYINPSGATSTYTDVFTATVI